MFTKRYFNRISHSLVATLPHCCLVAFCIFSFSLFSLIALPAAQAAAPTANAGPDQSKSEDDYSTTLDGSASSDPENDTLTYSWTETDDASGACMLYSTNVSGPTVGLSNKVSSYTCTFSLVVNDGIDDSTADTVTVSVAANDDPPTAYDSSGTSVTFETTTNVYLYGNEPDGQTLSYAIVSSPSNGTLGAVDSALGQVMYTPDDSFVGSDSFTFTVSDGTTTSSPATINLNIIGLTITPTDGGNAATEGGTTDTFTVVLPTAPYSTVDVLLSTDGYCAVDQSTLTFDTMYGPGSAYNIPQTVTITATDDSVASGTHDCVISLLTSSSDYSYNSIAMTQNVTITDNDTAGVSVTASGGSTNITEGSSTDSYTLVLTSKPLGSDVTITATSDADCTVATSPLTFGGTSWNVPQTVTVTAVDDSLAEGSHSCTITHTTSALEASGYNALSVSSIVATVTDDDSAGVTIVEAGGSTTVTTSGTTDSYTVVLSSQPSANVVITPTAGSGISTSPASLTFTTSNWATPQTITVSESTSASAAATITHAAASSDSAYNATAVTIASVTVTITDDTSEPEEETEESADTGSECEATTVDAIAGSDQNMVAAGVLSLDSSASTGEATCEWSIVSGSGSIDGSNFTAGAEAGDVSVQLSCTACADSTLTDTDDLTIHISSAGAGNIENVHQKVFGVSNNDLVQERESTDASGASRIGLLIGTTGNKILLPEDVGAEEQRYYLIATASGAYIVATPEAGNDRGMVYLIHRISNNIIDLEEDNEDVTVLEGVAAGDLFGEYITVADVLNVAGEEVLVSAPGANAGLGILYILSSNGELLSTIDGTEAQPIRVVTVAAFANADVADLVFGPDNRFMNPGLQFDADGLDVDHMVDEIIFSSAEDVTEDMSRSLLNLDIVISDAESSLLFQSVVFGDMNGDGQADLAISTNDGRVLIYYTGDDADLSEDDADVTITGGEAYAGFGQALAFGDMTGDGIDELVIGAPEYDGAASQSGAVIIVLGSEDLPSSIELASSPLVVVIEGGQNNNIGSDVLLADTNSDGKDEGFTPNLAIGKTLRFDLETETPEVSNSVQGSSSLMGCSLNRTAAPVPSHALFLITPFIIFSMRRFYTAKRRATIFFT